MSGPQVLEAGFASKSDCLVRYAASEDAVSMAVQSSVQTLFGEAIRRSALEMLDSYGVATGRLDIEDDGALDLVIRARIEAVLRKAGFALQTGERRAAVRRPPTSRDRTRHTRLYVPGDQPHFALNAELFGADMLVFDLEDSVAGERKFEARILVRRLLENEFLFEKSEVAVRINVLRDECGKEDIDEIVAARPHVILLPKCESCSDVKILNRLLSLQEKERGIEGGSIYIAPIIETAKGALAATAIARASDRNVALCFGYEDFSRDIRARPAPETSAVQKKNTQTDALLAREMIVLAARSAGIQPLDSVFSDIEDTGGLTESCYQARALGFEGKAVIHPAQIEHVRRAFSPSREEVERAKAIVAAYEESLKEGGGAVAFDGQMIDVPLVDKAKRVIEESGRGA
jgi:citrate lyase subunit beta/citryl-CoA lyase